MTTTEEKTEPEFTQPTDVTQWHNTTTERSEEDADGIGKTADSTVQLPWRERMPSFKLAALATLITIGGAFSHGFQVAVTNPLFGSYVHFLNESLIKLHDAHHEKEQVEKYWGVIIACLSWGELVGCMAISRIAEQFGRKWGLIFVCAVQVLALAGQVVSYFLTNYIMFAASRFVLGVAMIIALGIGPMYVSECSPRQIRGSTSMAAAIVMHFALLAGAIVGMPQLLGGVRLWWAIHALHGVIIAVTLGLLTFVHESPRYLVARGRVQGAKNSLEFYYGLKTKREVDVECKRLQAETSQREHSATLCEIFADPYTRRCVILSVVIMAGIPMSGIVVLDAYTYKIMVELFPGDQLIPALANVAVNFVPVFGVFLTALVVEKWGRKPILIFTFAILAASNLLIGVLMILREKTDENKALYSWSVVVLICVFGLMFSTGGSVCLFLASELVKQSARSTASTGSMLALTSLSSIMQASYLPMAHAITAGGVQLAVFLPACLVSVAVTVLFLPETKGKTVTEVNESLHSLSFAPKSSASAPQKK